MVVRLLNCYIAKVLHTYIQTDPLKNRVVEELSLLKKFARHNQCWSISINRKRYE